MGKFYDATQEHKMIEKSAKATKGHPNNRIKGINPYSKKVVN